MKQRRSDERGAVPVESTFAIILLMLLALGVIQVALSLYARNVVAASAHEGARAAVERGFDSQRAEAIVRETVRQATGSLVDDLSVDVRTLRRGGRVVVNVHVGGIVNDLGPIPFPIPLSSNATAYADLVTR